MKEQAELSDRIYSEEMMKLNKKMKILNIIFQIFSACWI